MGDVMKALNPDFVEGSHKIGTGVKEEEAKEELGVFESSTSGMQIR
jgi:hypothetical protein